MKNPLFAIGLIIILPVAGIVLSGCASPAGESFTLEAPGCTATWNANTTWVYWSKVEEAHHYVIYAKRFYPDKGESAPRDPKIFDELYTTPDNKESKYVHDTDYDFAYAVKAFNDKGESSDFSNVAFTW